MAALTKGTTVYLKDNEEATLYLRNYQGQYNDNDNKFPNTPFRIVQTYYGNENGAASSPENKYYKQGETLGVAQGEVVSIGNDEYQILETEATWRKTSGVLGLGAGIYSKFSILTAIQTAKLSIDAVKAKEQVNERENADNVAKEKAAKAKAALVKSLTDAGTTPLSGNSGTGNTMNITKIVIYVFAFLGLIIGGVLWWKGKQNKTAKPQA